MKEWKQATVQVHLTLRNRLQLIWSACKFWTDGIEITADVTLADD